MNTTLGPLYLQVCSLVLGEVGILMEAKHPWRGHQGQVADVLQVFLATDAARLAHGH